MRWPTARSPLSFARRLFFCVLRRIPGVSFITGHTQRPAGGFLGTSSQHFGGSPPILLLPAHNLRVFVSLFHGRLPASDSRKENTRAPTRMTGSWEDLHILESYGWATNVHAKRSDMEAGHPWYLATADITDEGAAGAQRGG